MPVMTKKQYALLSSQLHQRFNILITNFNSRELKHNKEGACGKNHWIHPEKHCATVANKIELSLVVEDFKAILAELKKLK